MRTHGWLRPFALLGVVAIVAAGCTGSSAGGDKAGGGGEPVVLRMAMNSGLGSTPVIQYFVGRIHELSGGDLRIEVVNSWGNFSPDAEQQVVRAVSTGKADLGWAETRLFDTMGDTSLQALTAPMLIDSYPLEQAVIASEVPGQMLEGLGKLGVSGLAILGDGLHKPIAVERPLIGLADWKGITFRSFRSQGQAEAIQALGAQPTDVFGPSLDEGLDKGEIQGFDKNLLDYQINIMEPRAPYVTANVNLWPGMDVLLANPGRLTRLTDEQRGWLRRAAADAAARSTGLVDEEDQIVATVCRAGARFANASRADLTALRQAFGLVYSSLEQNPQTKSFIARIKELKESTPSGAPLAIPAGCTGSASKGQGTNDPLTGTWQTAKLTESQMVRAFVAAGGSEKDGHATFSRIDDQETKHYVVVTLTFQDGAWAEYATGDGRPATVPGSRGTYEIGDDGTVTLDEPCCTTTFRYDLSGDTLRLHGVKLDPTGATLLDPTGATLFASFPFTRSG